MYITFFIDQDKYNEEGYVKNLPNVKLKLLKEIEENDHFAIGNIDTSTIDTMGKKYRCILIPDFFIILTPLVTTESTAKKVL